MKLFPESITTKGEASRLISSRRSVSVTCYNGMGSSQSLLLQPFKQHLQLFLYLLHSWMKQFWNVPVSQDATRPPPR